MDHDWGLQAADLAAVIAGSIPARMETRNLTERLIEFVFTSRDGKCAQITVLVSPHEVIVSAGRGTRFELDPLPESREEVQRIARAIGRGGLTEAIGARSVGFELNLEDGSRLTGRSKGIRTGPGGRQTIRYPPFAGQ